MWNGTNEIVMVTLIRNKWLSHPVFRGPPQPLCLVVVDISPRFSRLTDGCAAQAGMNLFSPWVFSLFENFHLVWFRGRHPGGNALSLQRSQPRRDREFFKVRLAAPCLEGRTAGVATRILLNGQKHCMGGLHSQLSVQRSERFQREVYSLERAEQSRKNWIFPSLVKIILL